MNLESVRVYRMTHIDNIPHILEHGITHKNSIKANPSYISIGDNSLINVRNSKYIKTINGTEVCLGDFIPFYFWVKMPMLYIIQNGFNSVEKRYPNKIVYLVCNLSDLANNHQEIYFSNGHATNALSSLYDKDSIINLLSILNWKSIKSDDWGGEINKDLKREKEAEFLVKGDIAMENIISFGCYNNDTKQKLISFGIDTNKVKINPQAYY